MDCLHCFRRVDPRRFGYLHVRLYNILVRVVRVQVHDETVPP